MRGEILKKGKRPAILVVGVATAVFLIVFNVIIPLLQKPIFATTGTSITKSTTSDFDQGTNTNTNTAGDEIKMTPNPRTAWYQTGGTWNYRKKIIIDHTKVPNTDQTDFPVLINLATDAELASHAQADGDDILITSDDQTTKLSHEIESYTTASGALVLWVKIPLLSHTYDTTVYMYYGNASATNQQSVNAVWSNGFLGVYHMNQTSGNLVNSVSASYTGTQSGTTSSTTGQIGSGTNFANGKYTISGLTIPAVVSYSAWFHRTSGAAGNIFSAGGFYSGLTTYWGNISFVYDNTVGSDIHVKSSNAPGAGWNYAAGRQSGSDVAIILNGTKTTAVGAGTSGNGQTNPVIGTWAAWDDFPGDIDEARISSVARSDDWSATEYANQNDPSTFYSLQAETAKTSVNIASNNISTDWYTINSTEQTAWKYRRQITIDHTKVPNTDQSEFPMLVKIVDETDPLFTKAQADGDDILFTNTSGNVKLSHELETFNTTTKELYAWVKIPVLKTATDTVIWLYYGNAAATSQQSATAVWSNGYAMVQHMKDTTTSTTSDSTSNANNGTKKAASDPVESTGKIGNAQTFNGTTSSIRTPDNTSLDVSQTGESFTVSAWIKRNGLQADYTPVFTKVGSGYISAGLGNASLVNRLYDGTNNPSTNSSAIADGSYVYGTYIRNKSDGKLYVYVNGSQDGAGVNDTTGDVSTAGGLGWIGNDREVGYDREYTGDLDEVRVASVARSADWIATEYNNQNSPETFASISKESGYYPVAGTAGWYPSTGSGWSSRQQVTIDHTKVPNTDQTDFPVLIKITNQSNGVFAGAQSDADDILFTSSNGTTKLSHEIETYTTTAGSKALWAWVKVPTLATATDTVLYMYYGNASATSQQNVTDVWSNGYAGVWHLDEASGSFQDSTSNNYDSTYFDRTYGASGKINKAANFATSGSLRVGDVTALNSTQHFTFDRWIYYNEFTHNTYTMLKYTADYAHYLTENINSGTIRLTIDNVSANFGYTNQANSGLTLSSWHHLVWVYDGTGATNADKIKMYVDGSQKSLSFTGTVSSVTSDYTGQSFAFSNGGPRHSLDETRVYSSSVNADWIATEYANQNSPETFMSFSMEASNISYASPTATGGGIIDTTWNGGWGTPNGFASTVTIPTNTSINYQMRSSAVGGSTDGDWTSWYDLGTATTTGTFSVATASMPAGITVGTNRYLQTKAVLASTDGASTPTMSDYTVSYLADVDAPTNPTTTTATVGGTPVTTATWVSSSTSPVFTFSGASDGGAGESGVAGYYIYYGTNASADPATYQAHVGAAGDNQTYNATGSTDGSHYYFRVKTADVAGNVSATATLFDLGFDTTLPTRPTFVASDPAGYTTVNSFDFTWPAGTDPNGAGGGASGVKWYEYKRATDGAWSHTADSATRTVAGVLAYQEGANAFYVRTIDNAGNTSSNYQQVTYYWSGVAPDKPTGLEVTPGVSDINLFTIHWHKPAVAPADPPIVGYYYSINAEPTVGNVTYKASTDDITTIGPDAYATLQGVNTIYVLSVNSAGNLSYEPAYVASATFTCVTVAPPIPTNVSLYDSSDRTLDRWMLTIQWQAGAGQDPSTFNHYAIYRSTDGLGFSLLATTTSTAYIDASGLNNSTTYFYNIKAVDNAGKESAQSSTVSKMPTGNYTTPPTILSGPTVTEIKVTGAKVSWTTDRASSSIVRYSSTPLTTGGTSASTGQFDLVTNHSVTLLGLNPGTVQYFQVQSLDEYRDYSQESAYSGTYSFSTLPAPAISSVKVANITLTTADIS